MAAATVNRVQTGANAEPLSLIDWGIFVLRVVLGVIFFMHGSQKVLGWFDGHGLAATVTGMGKMGISAPLAYLSIFTEFLGGMLLVIGAFTRIVGVGLLINMIVATVMVAFKNGFFMSPSGKGYEYNLALMGMSLALALTGPGAFGLGDWELRIFRKPAKA
jgi:putative oxidoreductase